MAARLALSSQNLQVQAPGEMRSAPFQSVEAMLWCLKMCTLGFLDASMDDKGDAGGVELVVQRGLILSIRSSHK